MLAFKSIWSKRGSTSINREIITATRINDYRFVAAACGPDDLIEKMWSQQSFIDVADEHAIGLVYFRIQPRQQLCLGSGTERGGVFAIDPQHLLNAALRRLRRPQQSLFN